MTERNEPKKICFIASSLSTHTQKWCRHFIEGGQEVHVVTFDNASIPGVEMHYLEGAALPGGGDMGKLAYLFYAPQVSRLIRSLKPDIVHAHYATSYGAVAALAGSHPFFLSLWGSDVFDFPRRSALHRLLLKWTLKKADWIMSTSKAMAEEARLYTNKKILITPFGVDLDAFSPRSKTEHNGEFVVGTVKLLAAPYGIDTLLRGCAVAQKLEPDIPMSIRIAGAGPDEGRLRQLCRDLGLEGKTEWMGYVDPEFVPDVWRSLDLAIIPSNSESFGVSAVEAQACGVPLVVSSIPGLMEATNPGESSSLVAPGDYEALGREIVRLYNDPHLREAMGIAGRKYVEDRYSLDKCFEIVERAYKERKGA